MGNQLLTNIFTNEETPYVSNLWGSMKSKLNIARKRKVNSRDAFIIKYKHNENKIDMNSVDERRIVFVSLIGLYQTWQKCPSFSLYTCLLLMPLKRKWIYTPNKYINELKSCFISQLSIFSDSAKIHSFIELLKWKDSQSLVVWMLDELDEEIFSPCVDLSVAPIWYSVSQKLTNLWDPISGKNYQALNLNNDHWQNMNNFHVQYDVKKLDILQELRFLTLKYKSMQEIIYESNPNSLNPITFYGENNNISQCHTKNSDVYDAFDDEEIKKWWISEDYNPNDIQD